MKALIFDTETTGLVQNRSMTLDQLPEVIEFYGVVMDLARNRKIRDYETLIRPTKYPMSDQVIKETKTKLSNDILKAAPLFAKVAPMIKRMIEEAPAVIAHNASFDREMLDIEFERLGIQLKWPRVICSIEQTIHLRGYRLSLTNLHAHLFDEAFADAHRAKADVKALVRCCVELYKQEIICPV